MKKGLLGSTALVAATAFTVGAAQAAEAPTYKISGYLNFLAFFVSQDLTPAATANGAAITGSTAVTAKASQIAQDDATMFFDLNEAEYHISASGATDNGLTYGLTFQLNAAGGADGGYQDEAYAYVGGSWGKLEFGANDGAEDSFAVGAESIMGGVGGFDGEYFQVVGGNSAAAGSGPSIKGDTGDANKLTYYSPDFSGFKLGVSYTPNVGQDGKLSGPQTAAKFTDSIGVGAQFSGNVGGGISLKLGAVYVTDTSNDKTATPDEDASSWSVGGIVGFQNFQIAASYGDSGDSHQIANTNEFSYWNVGASFEQGPLYLSAGYHVSTVENVAPGLDDELSVISLTADYSLAPGLAVLAEVNLSSDDVDGSSVLDNDATTVIVGTKVSF